MILPGRAERVGRAAAIAILIGCLGLPRSAGASYSPPLNRVRIDRDRSNHTPSLLFASETRGLPFANVDLSVFGVQYLGQLEWESGFGVQLGAAVSRVSLSGTVLGRTAEASGYVLGGQLRLYKMLWSGGAENARPHAITAFINLRALYYDTGGGNAPADHVELKLFNLTGGAGLMAELSLLPWLSFCPYAWLTPGFTTNADYRAGDTQRSETVDANLRTPLLFGADLWIYLFPSNGESHLSLSVLASVIDTSGSGNKLLSGVLGYTF